MNVFWFRCITWIVTLLMRVRHSLRDLEGTWRILKRLVVKILCLLVANWWTSFFTKSWYLMMKSRDRLIYHLGVASMSVPDRSLHFKELGALMMVICMLMEVICSYGSMCPSNLANEGGLKLSRTSTSHISSQRGWGSRISSSPMEIMPYWHSWIWRISSSRAWFWRHKYP